MHPLLPADLILAIGDPKLVLEVCMRVYLHWECG